MFRIERNELFRIKEMVMRSIKRGEKRENKLIISNEISCNVSVHMIAHTIHASFLVIYAFAL